METKLIFRGFRSEHLGRNNILGGEGGTYAKVILYAPDGTVDDTLIGYTMTSDAERYTPIDDGEYTCIRRAWRGSGKISKHYQLFENGKDNIRTLDGKINRNCPHQLRPNGEGYKTSIFIHSTLKPTNRVGSQTSKGCLLLDWHSMQRVEELLIPLGNGVSFRVIVKRTK